MDIKGEDRILLKELILVMLLSLVASHIGNKCYYYDQGCSLSLVEYESQIKCSK